MPSSLNAFSDAEIKEFHALSNDAITGSLAQLQDLLDMANMDRDARDYRPTKIEERLNLWAKSFFPDGLVDPRFAGDIVNIWLDKNLARPSLPAESEGFLNLTRLLDRAMAKEIIFTKMMSSASSDADGPIFYVNLECTSPTHAMVYSAKVGEGAYNDETEEFEGSPLEMWEKFMEFSPRGLNVTA